MAKVAKAHADGIYVLNCLRYVRGGGRQLDLRTAFPCSVKPSLNLGFPKVVNLTLAEEFVVAPIVHFFFQGKRLVVDHGLACRFPQIRHPVLAEEFAVVHCGEAFFQLFKFVLAQLAPPSSSSSSSVSGSGRTGSDAW